VMAYFNYTPVWYSSRHKVEQVLEQSGRNPAIPVSRKES